MKRTIAWLAGNVCGVARCLALAAAIGVAGEAEATIRQIKVAQGNYTWAETSSSKSTYAWESTSEATAGVPVEGDSVYCSRIGTITGDRTVTLPSDGTKRLYQLVIYRNADYLTTFQDGKLNFKDGRSLWLKDVGSVVFKSATLDFSSGARIVFDRAKMATFDTVTISGIPNLSFNSESNERIISETVNFNNTVATVGNVYSSVPANKATRYLNFTNSRLTVSDMSMDYSSGAFADPLGITVKLGANNTTSSDAVLKINGTYLVVSGSTLAIDVTGKANGTYKILSANAVTDPQNLLLTKLTTTAGAVLPVNIPILSNFTKSLVLDVGSQRYTFTVTSKRQLSLTIGDSGLSSVMSDGNGAYGYVLRDGNLAAGEEVAVFTKTETNLSWPVPAGVTSIEYLLIGGGGAGGAHGGNGYYTKYSGGGGGAGGYVYEDAQTVVPGHTLTVRVGAGGKGDSVGQVGASGSSTLQDSGSTFNTVTAYGGGYGYSYGRNAGDDRFPESQNLAGASGGGNVKSGYGGTASYTTLSYGKNYGSNGGAGNNNNNFNGGGGGGAGGPGADAYYSASSGTGNGGAGKVCSITGVETYYAGGGGGSGCTDPCGVGGIGGGGNGSSNTGGVPTAGADGLGGGGGGAGNNTAENQAGGDGGDGVVIIRYATSLANRPTVTPDGGTWTRDGTDRKPTVSPATADPGVTYVWSSDGAWTEVGTYTFKAQLSPGYRWSDDGTTADIVKTYTITSQDPPVPGVVTTNAMANASWGYVLKGLPSTAGSGTDTVLVFTGTVDKVGTMTYTLPASVQKAWCLVVGGGGSGGIDFGNYFTGAGGGGAGGMREEEDWPITTSLLKVCVGRGADGVTAHGNHTKATRGNTGGTSALTNGTASIEAIGGGYGAARGGTGGTGGSGGGAGYTQNATASGGAGTVGQGNEGGSRVATSDDNQMGGGGGGGAGGVGASTGTTTGNTGGAGGAGKTSEIGAGLVSLVKSSDGKDIYCAGGGGGGAGNGAVTVGGDGGEGGGGAGGGNTASSASNYGCGGGGSQGGGADKGDVEVWHTSGAGYQGVVIVRYSEQTATPVPTGTDHVYAVNTTTGLGTEYTGVADDTASPARYTLSGTKKASACGTYTVTAKLTADAPDWEGGGRADKTITWRITPPTSLTDYYWPTDRTTSAEWRVGEFWYQEETRSTKRPDYPNAWDARAIVGYSSSSISQTVIVKGVSVGQVLMKGGTVDLRFGTLSAPLDGNYALLRNEKGTLFVNTTKFESGAGFYDLAPGTATRFGGSANAGSVWLNVATNAAANAQTTVGFCLGTDGDFATRFGYLTGGTAGATVNFNVDNAYARFVSPTATSGLAGTTAFRIVLGANNPPSDATQAPLQFAGAFVVGADSTLAVDATALTVPGTYPLITAGTLTDNAGLVDRSTVQVAQGMAGGIRREGNGLYLVLRAECPVAQVGTTTYTTLEAAFASATNGATVVLLTNVVTKSISVNANVTFQGDVWEVALPKFEVADGKTLTIAGGYIGADSITEGRYSIVGGKYVDNTRFTLAAGYHYAPLASIEQLYYTYAYQVIKGDAKDVPQDEVVLPALKGDNNDYVGEIRYTTADLTAKGITGTTAEIVTNLNTIGENSNRHWENLVLGLSHTDPNAVPILKAQQTNNANMLKLQLGGLENIDTNAGATVRCKVLYSSENTEKATWLTDGKYYTPAQIAEQNLPESGVRYYRVEVEVIPAK